jgi:hypothetical protein
MITSKNGQTADTANFVHGCFMVRVGTDFQSYLDIVKYAQQDEIYNLTPSDQAAVNQVLNGVAQNDTGSGDNDTLPIYFSKTKCRDTTLGGNDAINPLPQFSPDDDIVHPHNIPNFPGSPSGRVSVGMGQVYSENYDDTQQILYMGFGIPVYSDVGNFWSTAVDLDMAKFVNTGGGITAEKIGFLIARVPVKIFSIATIPAKFIEAVVGGLQKVPITKYYAFSSQMPMYFRFVNTILVHLATNMNLMGSSTDSAVVDTGSVTTGKSAIQLLNDSGQGDDMSGMPEVFAQSGLDMAKIMTKRFFYERGDQGAGKIYARYTDDAMFKAAALLNGQGVLSDQDVSSANADTSATNNTGNNTNSNGTTDSSSTPTDAAANTPSRKWTLSWVDAFGAAYTDAIYDGHMFIGFRIDKGMGASESFSNSTGESQLAQAANAKFQQGREVSFGTMSGEFGNSGGVSAILSSVAGAVTGLVKGLSAAIHLDPLAAIASGSAKVDIPEVWMNSNYSRSASFSISCLSPYGDMASIFQSEYVPLACLLAGTLPRGTGYASHSSPFICQAYCRGIFSSPLCIVESLDIQRGADQFGFTMNRLPLKISMHVTLKDLTPSMYMNMGGDQGIAKAIFGTDDNFGEYMLTLSGMGLRDRLAPFRTIRRKTQIFMSTLYKNKLSPFMLGMEGGNRFLVSRVISAIVSGGRGLPGN